MFPAKSLQAVVVALWLSSVFDFHFEAYGVTVRDTKCDPPCQQDSPPSSGDPSYGAAPPPPSGYSIYGAPPPPPQHEKGQSKCPPAGGVQCCTPPAPNYAYGPPNPYSTYGPPNPYSTYGPPSPYSTYGPPSPYAPPNTYTNVPYGKGERSASVALQFLVSMLMLFSSFIISF